MFGGLELLALGAVGVVAVLGAVAAAVARDRRRRNQVVPGTDTGAPLAWAGAHTPEARLHRRLRDAVTAVRAIADPDGSLLSARVEIERAAVEVDRHLVALSAMHERERAGRIGTASSAVAAIESAAASLADIGGAGRNVIARSGPGRLQAVEEATTRVDLLREAVAELDEVDATAVPHERTRPPRGPVEIVDGPGTRQTRDVPGESDGPDDDHDRRRPLEG